MLESCSSIEGLSAGVVCSFVLLQWAQVRVGSVLVWALYAVCMWSITFLWSRSGASFVSVYGMCAHLTG